MLILTRKVGESVVIGDDVKLTVLSSKGNQIRLGIQAPKDVPVHREEIFDRISNDAEKVVIEMTQSNSKVGVK